MTACTKSVQEPQNPSKTTEGQLHQLKLVKRQRCDRAKLDLLKCRSLLA